MTAPSVPIGAVIAGKYRVERVLGAGAMGVVVAARHVDLQELRAIKLMLPPPQDTASLDVHLAPAQAPEHIERFFREARAAARLRSQHVAKVHDVGRLDTGAPYAVIEYLEGSDLKAVLDERGTLPVAEAILYLTQVGEAVGEAHAAGIVHRDLKPANLFLTRGPTGAPIVKVLDFGIAKMASDNGPRPDMTATSQMLGTPLYMSPEQMRGARDVDGRTDIWALGVILFRMLTGRTPFAGSSVTEICASVVADAPPAPRSLSAAVPEAVEAVILRCLEKDPSRRYATVAEFTTALIAAGAAGQASSAPRPSAPAPGPGPEKGLLGTVLMDPPAPKAPIGSAPGIGQGTSNAGVASGIGQGTSNAGVAPGIGQGTSNAGVAPGIGQGTSNAGIASGIGQGTSNAGVASGIGQGTSNAGAPPVAQWTAPSPAVSAPPAAGASWGGGQAPYGGMAGPQPQALLPPQVGVAAPPKAGSRTGLFIGLGVVLALGIGGAAAYFVTAGDGPSSQAGGSAPSVSSGPAAPGPAISGPGTNAGPSPGKPGSRPVVFGQTPSGPTAGSGAPSVPAIGPPGATPAAPASSPAPGPAPPSGGSGKNTSALLGVLMTCWKGNEGAEKGEPASSATVQVTLGPPRSIVVSGPAKAKKAFTACVVTKASSAPLDPSEPVSVASSALPAGPQ